MAQRPKFDPDGSANAIQRRPRPKRRDPSAKLASDERIWKKYVSGKNERVIAIEEDMSAKGVRTVIDRMRKVVNDSMPTVDEFRTILVEGTRDVLSTMTDLMHSEPVAAYSNGKPIMNVDPVTGEQTQALDYTVRLQAADRILRAHERLAKMVGVEAPTETNVTIIAQSSQLASAAAAEALARLQAAANPLPIASTRDVGFDDSRPVLDYEVTVEGITVDDR